MLHLYTGYKVRSIVGWPYHEGFETERVTYFMYSEDKAVPLTSQHCVVCTVLRTSSLHGNTQYYTVPSSGVRR
jgi:hypothetical protein